MNDHRAKRHYADGPFGQVHYRKAGDGAPLVLCHQSPDSSVMYEPVYPRLAARGFMAIGLDTPGYGMSDAPERDPTIEDFACAVGAVLDHLGLGRACLLGHHTGAMVAAHFAWMNPGRVDRLILSAPQVATDESLRAGRAIRHQTPQVRLDGGHLIEMWRRRLGYPMANMDIEMANSHFCRTLAHWDGFFNGSNAVARYDIRPALRSLQMPVLVMAGVHDGLYGDLEKAKAIRPDFTYAELSESSGYVVEEQPEAWVQQIARFCL